MPRDNAKPDTAPGKYWDSVYDPWDHESKKVFSPTGAFFACIRRLFFWRK